MPAWAIVLCNVRGRPSDPEERLDVEFLRTYFLKPGAGGLYDYWRDLSYGRITLDGSRVFGPFDLPFTKDDADVAYAAEIKAAAASGARVRARRDKMMEMVADDVSTRIDFSPFSGVIFIFNGRYETGAGETRVLLPDGTARVVPGMVVDVFYLDAQWFGHLTEHESGHMLGLKNHARILNPFLPPKIAEYGDG